MGRCLFFAWFVMDCPESKRSESEAESQQPALFADDAVGNALLLDNAQLDRICTGRSAERLKGLRELILLALEAGVGVETIATRAGVSAQVVRALKSNHWEKVVGGKKEFGALLLQTGLRWIGLARSKENEAEFRDLVIGAGIMTQRGLEAAAMGEIVEKEDPKELVDASQVMDRMKQLLAVEVPAEVPPADSGSVEKPSIPCISEAVSVSDAGLDARMPGQVGTLAVATTTPAAAANPVQEGEGGGLGRGVSANDSMGRDDRGFGAKAPSPEAHP